MSARTVEIGDAWKARRDAGLPCWCGEPINHVGWPVCGDTALGREATCDCGHPDKAHDPEWGCADCNCADGRDA